MTVLEQAYELVKDLSPLDKIRLVEKVMGTLERDLANETPQPRSSGYGMLSNVSISERDIDDVRCDFGADFSR